MAEATSVRVDMSRSTRLGNGLSNRLNSRLALTASLTRRECQKLGETEVMSQVPGELSYRPFDPPACAFRTQ